jgi:short-subunit dehydrogenase
MKILITGGSDGLGKAIAMQLARSHEVVILSSDETKLRVVAKQLGCGYQVCDVRDYQQLERTVKQLGRVDCLINSAGLWLEGPLDETDPKRIEEVLMVNTLGTINATKAVVPTMKEQKNGLIINVISQAGLNARAGWPIYIASKWAITGFTKSMRLELEPFGIAVTGFYPGTMNTEMFARSGAPKDVSQDLNTQDAAKTIEFVLSLRGAAYFPEIGMMKLKN